MTVGIYKLNFCGTNKVYIGQSIDIERRYISHKTSLKNQKSRKKLQQAYNEFGMPNLEILVECTVDELDSIEEEAIAIYDSVNNGFNAFKSFTNRQDLYGENAGNAKYSNDLIIEVFHYLVDNKLTHREIIEITGISRGALADVSSGASHSWLKNLYPAEYKLLLELKGTKRKVAKNIKTTGYPQIISPDNIIYDIKPSLRGFCREHNLNHGSLGEVLRGHKKQYKGWKVPYTT
jgi:predicted XRE-type DNA-binding protein